jgi:hypothetical protein
MVYHCCVISPSSPARSSYSSIGMTRPFSPGFESRIDRFLGDVGEAMPRKDQRASSATHPLGLLSDAERKSIGPRAARTSDSVDIRAESNTETCKRSVQRVVTTRTGGHAERTRLKR